MNAEQVARGLGGAIRCGGGWAARCPGPRHRRGDRRQSLTIHDKPGDINPLVHCHTGCSQEELIEALTQLGLWEKKMPNGKTHFDPPGGPGLTLEQYAEAKQLPIDFLRSAFDLRDATYRKAPAVEMRYYGEPGAEFYMVKFRIALAGGDKTRWKKGNKARLYGLWKLDKAKERGELVIVEGESDTQTCWLHDFSALGLPGAAGWNEERDAGLLDDIGKIYVIVEPDNGGVATLRWLATSSIRERARVVRMPPETKDPSALYLLNPEGFAQAFRELLDAAEPPPPPKETGQPPEYAEDRLATRFTEQHATSLKYVAKWGRWLLWNGSHWQEEDTLKAYDLARGICREASAEVMSWAKPNIRLAAAIASAKTVAAVERLAKADRRLAATTEQWDASAWLLDTGDSE